MRQALELFILVLLARCMPETQGEEGVCCTSCATSCKSPPSSSAVMCMDSHGHVHDTPHLTPPQGIKFPRYVLFGNTPRLAAALQGLAPPMSVHVSEMLFNRLKVGFWGLVKCICQV